MIVENPALCVSLYKNVFSAKEFINKLEETIEDGFGEDLSWDYSRVGNGQHHRHRTSLSCGLTTLLPPYPENNLSKIFREQIYNPVKETINDYVEEHCLPNGAHELISLLKYSGLAEYHAHYDHAPQNKRVFSLVACLGSPESGGELEFVNFNLKLKLEEGDVVYFPSNFPYMHIAHPVTAGTKYSMVTWFQ